MIGLEDAITIMAKELGDQAYHQAMGGSMNAWSGIDPSPVARTLAVAYGVADQDECIADKIGYIMHEQFNSHWPKENV